jgi:hypothetical protein
LQNAAKEAGQEDVIDDESILSEEDIEEELGYISPLDSVDSYLAFKRSLSSGCPVPLTHSVTDCVFSLPNEEPFGIPGLHYRFEHGSASAPDGGDEACGSQGIRGVCSSVTTIQGNSLEIMEW